jgi:hypothetical protein
VLRSLAQREGRRVADIARGLRRTVGQVRDVVLELIGIDVLRREADGGVWLLPVWLALERDRQAPPAALTDPRAGTRVLQTYQERLRALQEAAGALFEARVHNLLRQFRGQTVSGRLLGAGGDTVTLPTVQDVRRITLPDPEGGSPAAPAAWSSTG